MTLTITMKQDDYDDMVGEDKSGTMYGEMIGEDVWIGLRRALSSAVRDDWVSEGEVVLQVEVESVSKVVSKLKLERVI